MHTAPGISLANIVDIVPKVSTLADVKRTLGNHYETEHLPAHQTKRRLLPAKVLLHFPDTKVVIVFLYPGDELSHDSVASVVGVEGGPLRTADGLHVGMGMADAEEIFAAGYRVHHRSSWCVEVVAAVGSSENYLASTGRAAGWRSLGCTGRRLATSDLSWQGLWGQWHVTSEPWSPVPFRTLRPGSGPRPVLLP